ncbi:hypothetical protein DBV15_06293, partial [Temnothorax longispinosus]
REELCGSNSAVTSGQLRRASTGWFRAVEVVVDPRCLSSGLPSSRSPSVLRRVACPRTSDDVSAFSGRPHGELRKAARGTSDAKAFAKKKKTTTTKREKKNVKGREREKERGTAHVGGEEDPSGSPWTTRREDPSITCVPHLFPVARTCRTSSPLQRRR